LFLIELPQFSGARSIDLKACGVACVAPDGLCECWTARLAQWTRDWLRRARLQSARSTGIDYSSSDLKAWINLLAARDADC
jgi:hypothetical protein